MKLGLVRHFKVITNGNLFLSSKEFAEAMLHYDVAPVRPNKLIINSADWDICYCSPMSRAITTAKTIYKKDIIINDLLVEVPISPFTKMNIKLPGAIWHIGARIAWAKSHKSQRESIHGTKERINKFYNIVKGSGHKKILIVAHGYFLHMFYKEMQKKGFKGEIEVNIQNGKLYCLEN